jgi:hypothetical protein
VCITCDNVKKYKNVSELVLFMAQNNLRIKLYRFEFKLEFKFEFRIVRHKKGKTTLCILGRSTSHSAQTAFPPARPIPRARACADTGAPGAVSPRARSHLLTGPRPPHVREVGVTVFLPERSGEDARDSVFSALPSPPCAPGNRGAERPARARRRGDVATSSKPGLVTESTCACIYH